MSDLSNALTLFSRSRTQLPVSAYFDEALYKAELERIFQSGPATWARQRDSRGGRLLRPTPGRGRSRFGAHARRRRADFEHLPPPPGRHAQGRGNSRHNIVCPLHRWTYSHKGELIGRRTSTTTLA